MENEKLSLLSKWKSRKKMTSGGFSILKAPQSRNYPLSRGQHRLYFLEQLYPNNPVYNSSEIYHFYGPLDIDRLRESLQAVLKVSDILRCSFHLRDGKPIQKVHDRVHLDIESIDLSNLAGPDMESRQEEILTSDSLAPFNLEHAPLLRIKILKRSSTEHILFITMHHIIMDKWSMDIFREQLTGYYKALPGEEALTDSKSKIQFTDYAYWQQSQEVDPQQLRYWKDQLSGEIPMLNLPTDFQMPLKPSFKGGSNVRDLPDKLSGQITDLSKKCKVTPYVFLLSAYYVLLHRYSGNCDILIGSPISTRNSRTLEKIIGFFDETIVLRTKFGPSLKFTELLELVRQTTMASFSNKDVPFDLLVKELNPERSASNNPFFRTMFIYHDVPPVPAFGDDIRLHYTFFNKGVSKFDLTLYVSYENGIFSTEFEYTTDLFKNATIENLQDHYRLLLEGIVEDPELTINKIPILTNKEKELFLGENVVVPGPYAGYNNIYEIFEDAVKNNPTELAIVFGEQSLTYAELNNRATEIANAILERTLGKNEIVGLHANRSAEMIAGLLGILKAGCAYLPIDTEYPEKRIIHVVEDSNVALILSDSKSITILDCGPREILNIDEIGFSTENPSIRPPSCGRDDLAYVIYTSGSTGKPKGVPVTHGNIINSTEGRLTFYRENPRAYLLMSSVSFDSSKAGIFWTLCTGGTLVVSENRLEQNIEKLGDVIASNSVTHTLMLPSLYKTVIEYSDLSKLSSLRTVIVAGEACTPAICATHFEKLPGVLLYNEYGPTEATVWAVAHKIESREQGVVVPIGKPVANAEVYLLDSNLEMVPLGAPGEIYIGGPGLAGRYINNHKLTKEAYIDHPFEKNSSGKLYKTGDLGRYNHAGDIEYLGRADEQVKIRGFRVELGEIEKILEEYKEVEKAIVLLQDPIKRNLAIDATTSETAQIIAYLERLDNEDQIDELLTSIRTLKEDEKMYLLQKLQ